MGRLIPGDTSGQDAQIQAEATEQPIMVAMYNGMRFAVATVPRTDNAAKQDMIVFVFNFLTSFGASCRQHARAFFPWPAVPAFAPIRSGGHLRSAASAGVKAHRKPIPVQRRPDCNIWLLLTNVRCRPAGHRFVRNAT